MGALDHGRISMLEVYLSGKEPASTSLSSELHICGFALLAWLLFVFTRLVKRGHAMPAWSGGQAFAFLVKWRWQKFFFSFPALAVSSDLYELLMRGTEVHSLLVHVSESQGELGLPFAQSRDITQLQELDRALHLPLKRP